VSAVETLRESEELPQSFEGRGLGPLSEAFQDFRMAERFVAEMDDSEPGWNLRWASVFLALNGRSVEASALVERVFQGGSPPPDHWMSHATAGTVALFAGDYGAAGRRFERAYELVDHPVGWVPLVLSSLYSDYVTLLGYAHQKMGDEERALGLFEETERYYTERIAKGDTSFRARQGLAAVHALRGEKEAAYDWLQQAIDAGFWAYAELERHPCFESLHGEERFQEMMAGVKARVEEMRRQVDAMEAAGK
jgi:tetratricopeptide (TPR) repeat protein